MKVKDFVKLYWTGSMFEIKGELYTKEDLLANKYAELELDYVFTSVQQRTAITEIVLKDWLREI